MRWCVRRCCLWRGWGLWGKSLAPRMMHWEWLPEQYLDQCPCCDGHPRANTCLLFEMLPSAYWVLSSLVEMGAWVNYVECRPRIGQNGGSPLEEGLKILWEGNQGMQKALHVVRTFSPSGQSWTSGRASPPLLQAGWYVIFLFRSCLPCDKLIRYSTLAPSFFCKCCHRQRYISLQRRSWDAPGGRCGA